MSDDQHADDRFRAGRELAGRLFAGAPRTPALPKELARHTLAHLFGDVWQDDTLAVEERSLLTCVILATLGRDAELRLHVRGARNLGIDRGRLEAAMVHVAHYAGWPAGVGGQRALAEVWDEMDAEGTE